MMMMKSYFVAFCVCSVLVLFAQTNDARNIPAEGITISDKTPTTGEMATATAPSDGPAGVEDKKNFIAYGGVGGFAGVGGVTVKGGGIGGGIVVP
ncbi:hypothetical protein E3N88_16622 [Mikania micrantha]|uniref:Glycine-rich protein n=1 Tax=Mikania micrantha TaxID=192012 RepID=A0A5N6NZA7_9ASTR|nr:hypothetical protein E3N88_16622 [Mikania micrantha]